MWLPGGKFVGGLLAGQQKNGADFFSVPADEIGDEVAGDSVGAVAAFGDNSGH